DPGAGNQAGIALDVLPEIMHRLDIHITEDDVGPRFLRHLDLELVKLRAFEAVAQQPALPEGGRSGLLALAHGVLVALVPDVALALLNALHDRVTDALDVLARRDELPQRGPHVLDIRLDLADLLFQHPTAGGAVGLGIGL